MNVKDRNALITVNASNYNVNPAHRLALWHIIMEDTEFHYTWKIRIMSVIKIIQFTNSIVRFETITSLDNAQHRRNQETI